MKFLFIWIILLASSFSFANSFPEIIKGCRDYTSTDKLEKLCIRLGVSPVMAKACRSTSTYTLERQCLLSANTISPEIVKGCRDHASTDKLEKLCIRLGVSPIMAKACRSTSIYTQNYTLERQCLLSANTISPEIVKGCIDYTSTEKLEKLCIRLGVSPVMAKACENTSTYPLERQCLRSAAKK
ncbi:MAG: hypothetical protein KAQ98_12815 [Bacteriovoracaceae bacterium]|nr:hypothetical protein [Bacteriovoracaceae bacterium]